jgi:integral membrane protein
VKGDLGALKRYRIMAYVVGVGLMVLVFVGIPIQLAGNQTPVAIIGPLHGWLYIVYLVFALDLARRARFTLLQMLGMVGAGLLPFLAFIVERKVTARAHAQFAAKEERRAAASGADQASSPANTPPA